VRTLTFPTFKPAGQNLIRPSDYQYENHKGEVKSFDIPSMFGTASHYGWAAPMALWCPDCSVSWLSDGPLPEGHKAEGPVKTTDPTPLHVKEIVYLSCIQNNPT